MNETLYVRYVEYPHAPKPLPEDEQGDLYPLGVHPLKMGVDPEKAYRVLDMNSYLNESELFILLSVGGKLCMFSNRYFRTVNPEKPLEVPLIELERWHKQHQKHEREVHEYTKKTNPTN